MSAPSSLSTDIDVSTDVLDVLVIGAGFAGLYQLDRLRGLGFNVKVFEAGSSLGGIWYWNCYPGARTDSLGHIYQFSREDLWRDWDFKELYPSWSGLRDYFAYVDSKLDLSRDIKFNTRVKSAEFEEARNEWVVSTNSDESVRAKNIVMCTGFGSKPLFPDIEGLDTFDGEIHHTGLWPQEGVDLTGKRVGIIGTGASGMQVTQEAAAVSAEVTVFQRTPNLALPMRQKAMTDELNRNSKATLAERFALRHDSFAGFDMDFIPKNALDVSDEEREATYEQLWAEGGFPLWLGNFQDVLTDERANRTMYDFWRKKVIARIADPAIAEKLAPAEPPFPFGTKRPSLEQNYFDVFNQDNVSLVDVNDEPILRVTPDGVDTSKGLHEFDVLVLATGYDANTGGITAIDIHGMNGQTIKEKWAASVDTFMGLATADFPNLLFVYGPQSPAGFCNGPTCAEYQGELVVDFLRHIRDNGYQRFEATDAAEKGWTAHVNELFEGSLFTKAKSWYYGANVPGKPRQMLNYSGGLPSYFTRWNESVAAGYDGFRLK